MRLRVEEIKSFDESVESIAIGDYLMMSDVKVGGENHGEPFGALLIVTNKHRYTWGGENDYRYTIEAKDILSGDTFELEGFQLLHRVIIEQHSGLKAD